MRTQPKPMTWQTLNRHKWFDEEVLARRQATYTVEDLRLMLKGWTWKKLLSHAQVVTLDGVMFHGRIGRFMNKPCIAVCALGHIVAMRYVDSDLPPQNWAVSQVIDGDRGSGLLLVSADFTSGRTGSIGLADLVVEDGQ